VFEEGEGGGNNGGPRPGGYVVSSLASLPRLFAISRAKAQFRPTGGANAGSGVPTGVPESKEAVDLAWLKGASLCTLSTALPRQISAKKIIPVIFRARGWPQACTLP
jgi:hypothetical protein